MSLTTKKRTLAQAPTPQAGEVTLYVDVADGLLKGKDPDGTGVAVTSEGGGSGSEAGIVIATIVLNGATGAVNNQAGEAFGDASRESTGVYLIPIVTPASPFTFTPIISARSVVMRSATFDFAYSDESNTYVDLTVRVWDHLGAAADCDWLYVAIVGAEGVEPMI